VFLAALLVPLPLVGTYLVTLFAGFFAFSSQVLVYAYVNAFYPDRNRASAMAWTSGIGRLGGITGPAVGGVLVGAGLAIPWGFLAFAATGALGAVFTALIPRRRIEEREESALPA
jgi:MFS family permease